VATRPFEPSPSVPSSWISPPYGAALPVRLQTLARGLVPDLHLVDEGSTLQNLIALAALLDQRLDNVDVGAGSGRRVQERVRESRCPAAPQQAGPFQASEAARHVSPLGLFHVAIVASREFPRRSRQRVASALDRRVGHLPAERDGVCDLPLREALQGREVGP